jgi:hypothetical protein
MRTKDWVSVAAIVVGPLSAVLVTYFMDRWREAKQRRIWIFRTLLATRARKMRYEHVQALNLIDVDFKGWRRKFKTVRSAWDYYRKHLNTKPAEDTTAAWSAWGTAGDDKLKDLLVKMAKALRYSDFDLNSLTGTAYVPTLHGEIEADELSLRRGLAMIVTGRAGLPITSFVPPNPESPAPAEPAPAAPSQRT